ncbi:MAG TPA: glycoside hydrolase family 97 catalytic domain-containing protein, partial [Acidobacteriota bacterium]|nr:glycoside hydrolase family 97 catalytic domain-containing protein [Acidobacteriota bacterium]
EEEVLRTYSDWGASGIKLDNYGGDHQDLVNELHHILRIAAQYKLTVDYHGAYKNTGIERTYPHFLTREAVMGLEYSKGGPRPTTAQHNVMIPYTRMLAGPMDYTPGAFDLDGADGFPKQVQTTRAQQIAMLVVYFSPFQMIVDYPDAYEASPDQFEFVKTVPTTWDDIRFIDGYPGDYIVLARKKGSDWYIGCMTDENSREVEISLDFLDSGRRYAAHIFRDGDDVSDDPQSVAFERREVTGTDTVTAKLAGSGGQAIKLTPIQ